MKSGYLKVLFVGLPFGLGCLIVGINNFINIPRTTEQLKSINGEITSFGMKDIYDKGADSVFEVFFIVINNREYYADLGWKIDTLQKRLPVQLKYNKFATVWHERGRKYIEQISVGENILYEYKPPYWIAHFFFWIGLITLVSGVGYLILHPEDLTGKKRKGKVSKW